ncbi:MAG: hypothetical protein A3G34_14930 [Candidatus Lindowbacteria bacterium RIFCSPLOWO2_12_FULL_62_27]|nr:MAG: hypothetical protein A3I06_10215 [Candidatus Lindowbacteria bacterium RIFCSPLOWO2_02_FULL_62_12]OGH63148.1 MAG: hypothetical protein A3G34_14930 [Candidatus Lindowbacteria bacterium RIFCSPLOWO2_12_FULL_62_27]
MSKVVLKLGDDVSTDIIYPGRFMATVLPAETPRHAFADIPQFNSRLLKKEIAPGSVIVAGKNFGCGSSREQAVSALKGHELVVAAKSFARIFLQNAVNLGLKTVACPGIEASEGDEVELTVGQGCPVPNASDSENSRREFSPVRVGGGHVINHSTGGRFDLIPLPRPRQEIMDAGGLIPYARVRLLKRPKII